MRVGWGVRDPALLAALDGLVVAESEPLAWPGMTGQLDLYLGPPPAALPDYLVTSIRCVVRIGDAVLVCRTPNDTHCVPGGRRDPGETWEETARREVAEETGWSIGLLSPLGFLRFALAGDFPADHPYPHPDIVQVVFTAEGIACEADGWRDTEGWEQSSEAVAFDDLAPARLPATQLAMVAALRRPPPRGQPPGQP